MKEALSVNREHVNRFEEKLGLHVFKHSPRVLIQNLNHGPRRHEQYGSPWNMTEARYAVLPEYISILKLLFLRLLIIFEKPNHLYMTEIA